MKKFYTILSLVILGISPPAFAQYFGGSGDGYSFSRVGSSGGEVPLPIKLIYFNAQSTDKAVNTIWSTSSQINNDYFTVERAADGINFEMLGTVKGAGNSNQKIDYSFTDAEPLAGNSYYRLKQTDFNGTFEYSNIVAVSGNGNKPDMQLYPSINNGNFNISGTEQNADLIIINSLGEKITTQKISSFITNVDISNSPNGIYYVYINSEKESVARKMIIMH